MTASNAMRYEPTDAPPWLLAALAGGLALFLILTPLLLRVLYPSALQRPRKHMDVAAIRSPRLQADPAKELAAYRLAEHRRLSAYGWTTPEHKRVHLPIERAITLTLQRGLFGWQKP